MLEYYALQKHDFIIETTITRRISKWFDVIAVTDQQLYTLYCYGNKTRWLEKNRPVTERSESSSYAIGTFFDFRVQVGEQWEKRKKRERKGKVEEEDKKNESGKEKEKNKRQFYARETKEIERMEKQSRGLAWNRFYHSTVTRLFIPMQPVTKKSILRR